MNAPVSVIVPVRNEYDLLVRAVESAAGEAAEIVIVLDASEPPTARTAQELAKTCRHVRVFQTGAEVPAGVCYARNLGISRAENTLLFPCDADDTIAPDGLTALVNAWVPGTFVYGGWNEINGERILPHALPAPIASARRKHVAMGRQLFHRDDWLAVGGYNPHFEAGYEDWAFTLALLAQGVQGVRIDKIVYNYYRRDDGRAAQARPNHEYLLRLLKQAYPLAFR